MASLEEVAEEADEGEGAALAVVALVVVVREWVVGFLFLINSSSKVTKLRSPALVCAGMLSAQSNPMEIVSFWQSLQS